VICPATARVDPRRVRERGRDVAGSDEHLLRAASTMSPMKQKPVSTKHAKTPPREAKGLDGKRKDSQPRRETCERIRKTVERHRETLDDLAK
jgi:hypothetical protein